MKTFNEIAKALTLCVVKELRRGCECEFCDYGLAIDGYEETHGSECPFNGYEMASDLDRLAAWARGDGGPVPSEVWEVVMLDGTRRRCLLAPGTTLAELVQYQGQPVTELRRLDPPAPRMQPIPTETEVGDERYEDF